jgi:hypothetical protein
MEVLFGANGWVRAALDGRAPVDGPSSVDGPDPGDNPTLANVSDTVDI